MLAYLIRRILQGVLVVFLVSIATFGILQLAPGSPVDILVGQAEVTDEQIALIEHKWGLDQPWYVQYFTWLGNMLQGDFGTSVVRTGVPVSTMLREAAKSTLELNFWALLFSTMIAIPIGFVAAIKRNSVFDYIATFGSTLGIALPSFWIGLMAIIIFSLELRWLPATGVGSWKALIMPVAVLATQEMALLARLTRGSALEVLRQDFVTTARAKGLAERVVIMRHVSRNALLPIVTVLGVRMAFILSGTIIVETIFSRPGLGQLFFVSVDRLDYQVVQAIVLLSSILVVTMNIVTDLVYAYIDPRIRIR